MRNKIIFSVFQSTKSNDENLIVTSKVLKLFNKNSIQVELMEGCYKGIKELSMVVDMRYLTAVKEIAILNSQESILLIDSESNATLHYMPVTLEHDMPLGIFTKVSKEEALMQDAYTNDLKGSYYICKQYNQNNLQTWNMQ